MDGAIGELGNSPSEWLRPDRPSHHWNALVGVSLFSAFEAAKFKGLSIDFPSLNQVP